MTIIEGVMGFFEWWHTLVLAWSRCIEVLIRQKLLAFSLILFVFYQIATYIITALSSCITQYMAVREAASSACGGVGSSTDIYDWINYGNSFLPIEELCGFIALYYIVVGALSAYRFWKSWIPMLSGS